MKWIILYKKYLRKIGLRYHAHGSTWKYTLDIYKLRICWWRRHKVNRLGFSVPVIGIGWG